MKLYRNAIILLVIVALLVGAYLLIINKQDEKEDTRSEVIRLTDYTSDKIESLTLINPDGTFVIEKKDTEWVLTSPTDLKYDSSTLSSIVINAASMIIDKVIEENAQDLSKYGLDKAVTVKIKDKEGKETVLEVGDMSPTKSGYYIKKADSNDVYLISTYTGNYLVTDRNGLRSKKLFDYEADDLMKLSMDRRGENVFESEREEGSTTRWVMTRPIKGSMNTSALIPMIDALINSTVSEFIKDEAPDPAQYGLDSPSYVFEFSTANETYKLKIGDEKVKGSKAYAQLEGNDEVFVMNITDYTFLDKPLKEIIEVFAYIVNIDEVKKIDLTMDGKTTHMTLDVYKDAEGKMDSDKDKFTVNGIDASGKNEDGKQPFRNFYQALIGISLDEIDVDGKPAGEPEIIIEYTLKSGTMKVEFVPKDEKYYYVVRNGEYAGILLRKNKDEFGVQGMKKAYNEMMDFLATQAK